MTDKALQDLSAELDKLKRRHRRDRKTFPRCLNGRLEQARPIQTAIALMHIPPPSHQTGRGNGQHMTLGDPSPRQSLNMLSLQQQGGRAAAVIHAAGVQRQRRSRGDRPILGRRTRGH